MQYSKLFSFFYRSRLPSGVKGIAASKFHSVFWTDDELYTWGLNAGQLGKSNNLFIILSLDDARLKSMLILYFSGPGNAQLRAIKRIRNLKKAKFWTQQCGSCWLIYTYIRLIFCFFLGHLQHEKIISTPKLVSSLKGKAIL